MRFTYLLVLLVAFAVLHEAESGWLRRAWRRVKRWGKRKIKTWAIKKAAAYAVSLVGKKRGMYIIICVRFANIGEFIIIIKKNIIRYFHEIR